MDILHTLLMFVVAIGVLITVHEYGHFWVARRVGIKVLKFSVGFGPALLTRKGKDGVQYVLAALPLGGYVKMAGEVPGEEPDLAPEEAHRAFNRKPVPQRMAVAAAGPVMNFLFAALVFVAVYLIGVQGLTPRIGYVASATPAAQAELRVGEEIRSVAGQPVQSWNEARVALMQAAMDRELVEVTVADGGSSRQTRLDLTGVGGGNLQSDFLYKAVGLGPYQPVVVGEVVPDSPAAAAGLQAGDRIRAINGETVASWQRFLDLVRESPGEKLSVQVARDGQTRTLSVMPEAVSTPDSGKVGQIGMRPRPLPADLQVTVRYGPLGALVEGIKKTGEMLWLTVEMLGRMVTGSVSSDNLGGPIAIAQFAGQSAEAGLVPFLWFLGMISLSLGFLNLLPIPVLDGGHLLFQAIEGVRGRPLDEETMARWQQAGIMVLLAVMVFAFYNDIQRLFQ
ncbi:RIP metalloprotease RseP [Thiohalorhabdus methylotrophus]|uniref:Zinc metalloprotease n=1 Tax=Thiohalorhabdus methylotrophus TaxID=3242694 RepID=A0ABV4TWP6_9GAMM